MIKNYTKIALRNLFRNKAFALTNLVGLTIGITCTILILLWVQSELSYNKFQDNYSSIYKVMANRSFNGQVGTDDVMVFPLAPALASAYPQIKKAVVTSGREPHILSNGEIKLKKNSYTVSGQFFELFSWKFISGSSAIAIADPTSIVLTRSTAKALFGNKDPLNRTVRMDGTIDFKVSALIEDVPGNSSLVFDFIIPYDYSLAGVKQNMTEWTNSSWNVYLQTVPGTNMKQLEKNINDLKKQHSPNDRATTYFTFPMSKWRLYSDFKDGKNAGGMIKYVRLFSIIGIIILLIACVNFMNFSTARSEKRAKEIGIRKTLGSRKRQLILQFFFESMILVAVAFILSLVLVYLLLPAFNSLTNKSLVLPFNQIFFWTVSLGIIAFTGFVAGSYPALYLSSFNPVKVLKGISPGRKKTNAPRQVLIVAQFAISIILIASTIIIYQQIKYAKDLDMGYNPDNLIMIPASSSTQQNFTVIKQELLQTGVIYGVTRTSSPITEVWWKTPGPDWPGRPANANLTFSGMSAEADFTKTMGIRLVAGNDFSGTPVDSSRMLLNKAAITIMGLKDPIGMEVGYNNKTYTISGIIDDVVMESPYKPVEPMMVINFPAYSNSIAIRLNNDVPPHKALSSIERVFTKYNAAFPFEYQFADQEFGKKFIAEELINKISNLFAILAIFISCIGLAGLASFNIENRVREIGVRKVLGASVQQILCLISKEFLGLVLIAFLIAAPVTWWYMHNWLQNYNYHISISPWMFLGVGGFILLLTIAVVSLNALKAAIANPVTSLRTG